MIDIFNIDIRIKYAVSKYCPDYEIKWTAQQEKDLKLHICRVIGAYEASDEKNPLLRSVLEYLTFNENNQNSEEFLVQNMVFISLSSNLYRITIACFDFWQCSLSEK